MECAPSFGHFQIVLYHESAEIRKELLSSAVNYTYCMPRLHFFGGKQIRVLLGVKSGNALRMHSRCTWRHREGLQNVHNTSISSALSP
jgi:hypothetical protein